MYKYSLRLIFTKSTSNIHSSVKVQTLPTDICSKFKRSINGIGDLLNSDLDQTKLHILSLYMVCELILKDLPSSDEWSESVAILFSAMRQK